MTANGKSDMEQVFQALRDSQKVTERTSNLIESVLKDVQRMREQSETLAVIKSRLDALETLVREREKGCGPCQKDLEDQIRDLDKRREENKDRIAEVERLLATKIETVKEGLQAKMDKHEVESTGKFMTLSDKVSAQGGKYGAIASIVISLIFLALNWILHHGDKAVKAAGP